MTSQKTQQKRDYEINKTVISCDAWHTDHDWSRHMARRPQQTPKTTSKQKTITNNFMIMYAHDIRNNKLIYA